MRARVKALVELIKRMFNKEKKCMKCKEVEKHLKKDSKTWKKLSKEAKHEAKSDKKLIKKMKKGKK